MKNELCQNSFSNFFPGKCVTECKPTAKCCTDEGNYAPHATQCGDIVYEEYYKCSDLLPGGAIMIQNGYQGCKGKSTICSFQKTDLYWSDWEVHLLCKPIFVCKPSIYKTSPGKCSKL
jgi:hypothetical protein